MAKTRAESETVQSTIE